MSSNDDNDGVDSDVEQRMAFTADNDYEEGHWIGNEFFARSEKRGRQQTKEERLYGVFADDDDENEFTFRQRKKDRKKGTSSHKADLTKPVNFVGGSVMREIDSDLSPKHEIKTEEKISAEVISEVDNVEETSRANVKAFQTLLKQATAPTEQSQAELKTVIHRSNIQPPPSKPLTNADFRSFLMKGLESVSTEVPKVEPEQQQEEDVTLPPAIPKPAKLDAQFGDWEKHTKGIGLKLMKKMGFTGRLGRNESGVTRQLEVKVRPGGIGLGFGNFKEATTLRVNREIEADRQGKTLEELEIELGIDRSDSNIKPGEGSRAAAEAIISSGLWRKNSVQRGKKRRYISAEELLTAASLEKSDEEIGVPQAQVIIDMRGPTVKYLNGYDDIATGGVNQDIVKPKLGQELLYNVHMIVSMAESEAISCKRRALNEQNRVKVLEKEVNEVKKRVDQANRRMERIYQVSQALDKIHSKVKETPDQVTPAALAKAFTTLHSAYPEEYGIFGLAKLAPVLATPILSLALKEWSPIDNPNLAVELFSRWRIVLEQGSNVQSNGERDYIGTGYFQNEEGSYKRLVESLILPHIRAALINDWKVYSNAKAASEMMSTFFSILPNDTFQMIADQCVMPKLRDGLAKWSPRDDGLSIHSWVIPWTKVLGSKLADYFPEIRRKLQAALKQWRPISDSENELALNSLTPWHGIMDGRSFEALICGSISPVFAYILRNEFSVDPSAQDPGPILRVLKWIDIMPLMHMEALLTGEFFPKWRGTLHTWLKSGSADLSEVAGWYQGWKSIFPEKLVENPQVQKQFTAALTSMDCILRNVPLPPPPRCSDLSYSIIIEQRRSEFLLQKHEKEKHIKQQVSSHTSTRSSTEVTFREVVEEFSANHSIEFVPKPGRAHLGKQIYGFGKANVYLDQNVAFVEASGDWTPVSLDNLLMYAQNIEK